MQNNDGKKNYITRQVKLNAKAFDKAIDNFNKQVGEAYKKHNISATSFNRLIIDDEKKDFIKTSLLSKKQYNKFIKDLNKANEKTLTPVKKGRLSDLKISRYEQQQFNARTKFASDIGELYGIKTFNDSIINTSNDTFERNLHRLVMGELALKNRPIRFRENYARQFRKAYGEEVPEEFLKLSDKEITELTRTAPNFDMAFMYFNKTDSKKVINARKEQMIKDIKKIYNKHHKRKK